MRGKPSRPKLADMEGMHWFDAGSDDGYGHAAVAPTNGLDPYVTWANISGFRGFTAVPQFVRSEPGASWVSIIGKVTDAEVIRRLAADGLPGGGYIYIPKIYFRAVKGAADAQHFTARVQLSNLGRLREVVGLERWELGLPARSPDPDPDANPTLLPENAGPTLPADQGPDAINARFLARTMPTQNTESLPLEVVAVIDYGCAFLHAQFQDEAGNPRIRELWDQGEHKTVKRRWKAHPDFGYGRVLLGPKIERVLNARRAKAGKGSNPDEVQSYQQFEYLRAGERVRRPILKWTHGTHVMDVVGGLIDPWTKQKDHASKASLLFVQLPLLTVADSSGGSLSVHVLDAVRHVLERSHAEAKIVIVLSQGTNAGPHDGSSLIESALDELLSLRSKNFAIVIGAGNSRHDRCHARLTIGARQCSAVELRIPPSDLTDTFVELWYPRQVQGLETELAVRLISPDGAPGAWVEAGKTFAARIGDHPVCAVVHRASAPNGHDAMALLALAPARNQSGLLANEPVVPAGKWTMEVRNQTNVPVVLDAWVERDDPLRGATPVWPHFVGESVTEEGTVNTIATGQHTIVAGALRRSDGKPSRYSSLGFPDPSNPASTAARGGLRTRPCPDVLAAADENDALPGVRAAAVRSGDTVRMNGTSVAAPTLARRLFNEMIAAPGDIDRQDWATMLDRMAGR